MHPAGCPHSPPGSGTECLPQVPAQKQVHFDLNNVLGDTPPLPTDLASFLGDATDKQINVPCPSAPSTMSSSMTSIMPTLQEAPGQRLAPLHLASLWLLVKPGPDVEVHQNL